LVPGLQRRYTVLRSGAPVCRALAFVITLVACGGLTGCGKKIAPALRSAAPSVQLADADGRKSAARSAAERALGEARADNTSPQVATREGESLIGQESTERPVGTAFSVVETHQTPGPADPAADAEPVVEPIHDEAASTGVAVAMVMLLVAAGAAAMWAVRRTSRRRTA
jgi:hypothetical protein